MCLSILFITFERCVNVSKIFLPSFKAVRRLWRDFFQKSDGRRRSKEDFFLASCGEYSSLIYRVVTMEYRTNDHGSACISSRESRTPQAFCSCRSTSKFLDFTLCFLSFELSCLTMSSPSDFSFKAKEQLFELLSPDLSCSRQVDCRLAVEKFESSLNIGDRVHELPFPSRQTVMHTVIMSCQFTRNDSLTWLVESERR